MTLLLPALIHGRYRDVKPRLRPIVKRMIRGDDDWIAAVEEHGMLDVDSTPGLIADTGPVHLRDEHFQMWLLWDLVRKRDVRGTEGVAEKLFTESLTRPWTLLGLVMSQNDFWLWHEMRHHRFLRAVCPHWETFCTVGKRYIGLRVGDDLWNCNTTVHCVMADQKLPLDILCKPPQPGALAAFLRSHGIDVDEPPGPGSA